MPGFFGNGNITFFEHISLMIRAGEARDAHGEDTYLSNLDAYKLPINFMTGEHNRCSCRRACSAPYDTLRAANGPEHYTPHRLQGLRPPRPAGWARTPNATCGRPPSPSWRSTTEMSTTADDSPADAPPSSTPGCRTSSATR